MQLPSILEEWLSRGEQMITPAVRPSWLLSEFDEPTWHLKTPDQFALGTGIWKGTIKVHWALRVPGGNLCDAPYGRLLRHCKLLVIARAESSSSKCSSVDTIATFQYYTLVLAEFLVVRFSDEAALHGLRCLTYSKLETLLGDFVRDGAAGVGHWIARWDAVIQRAFESDLQRQRVERWCKELSPAELAKFDHCDRSIVSFAASEPIPVQTTLPTDVLRFARRWLACEGAFTPEGLLRIAYLDNAIERDGTRLRAALASMRLHFRQFEFVHDYRPFEHCEASHREFLSRRFISTDERGLRGPVQQYDMYVHICGIVRLSSYVEDLQDSGLPSIPLESRLPRELRGGRDSACTPSIPTAIALKLLDQMIEWTLHRTKPLFDYFSALAQEVIRLQGHSRVIKSRTRIHGRKSAESAWERAFKRVPIPAPLADLELCQFFSARSVAARQRRTVDGGSTIPAQLRRSMTVIDAVELSASILICLVSMLCARRVSEVLRLPRGCVISRGRSSYLQFEISKLHIDGVRARALRPLPAFLARALRVQQEFSRFLVSTHMPADPRITGALFVVPSYIGCRRANKAFVYTNLDLLCDYFETARDKKGRRWYLRPHECRRFFALTFFHAHGQEASLPALSWMLGHSNLQHTWRYIKEQLTGSEISHSEAMFAHAAITGDAASRAAKQLRSTVLKHFGAARLELIDPEDIQALLELLHTEGRYRAEPCSIRTADGYRHTILIHLIGR
jgi:hypothetical protein